MGDAPAPTLPALFGAEHERTYGFRAPPEEPVELMGLSRHRARHAGAAAAAGRGSACGLARCPQAGAHGFRSGWVETPVVDRAGLAATPREGR